jgi:hypothetical protein
MLARRCPRWLAAVMILAGCWPLQVSPTVPRVSTMPLLSPVATDVPLPTVMVTPSPMPSEVVSTPGPTATSTPYLPSANILQYQPLKVLTEVPPDSHPVGNLLVTAEQVILLDMADRATQTIGSDLWCLGTSPNRKWFSFCQLADNSTTNGTLIIESSDLRQRKKVAIRPGLMWGQAVSWLDNEHLVFNVAKPPTDWTTNYPVAVFDPFTGDQQVITSEYPHLITWTVSGPAPTTPFPYSSVVYDPSLKLVVYPQQTDVGWYVVLWDRQAKRALARVADLGGFGHLPIWSPSADQFVVAVDPAGSPQDNHFHDEWYSVTRQGQATRLTHFGDFFSSVHIDTASWSPDGQRLAFWVDVAPSLCKPGQNLALMVLATQQITDYCVYGLGYPPVSPPIWSPDGRYIAVNSSFDNQFHLLLVDTREGWVAATGISGVPVGWLAAP